MNGGNGPREATFDLLFLSAAAIAAPSTPAAAIANLTDPAKLAIRRGLSLLYAALNGG